MSANGDDSDGSDTDYNFESNVGSRRYPVHDCCEFEDADSLRRLICVRQGDSSEDDSSSSSSSSPSSSSNDESEPEREEENSEDDDSVDAASEHAAAAAAAMGHSPAAPPPSSGSHAQAFATTESSTVAAGVLGTGAGADAGAEEDEEMADVAKAEQPVDGATETGAGAASSVEPQGGKLPGKVPGTDGMPALQTQQRDEARKDAELGGGDARRKGEEALASVAAAAGKGGGEPTSNGNGAGSNDSNSKRKGGDASHEAGAGVNVPNGGLADPVAMVAATNGLSAAKAVTGAATATASKAAASPAKKGGSGAGRGSGSGSSASKSKGKKPPRVRKAKFYCPYDLNERDLDENTPLHIAIHARKLDCVRHLLQARANVHRKCDGSPPVHTAISMGAIPAHANFAAECLSLLIAHGADLTARDESLHTPLYLTAMANLPRCASIILHDSSGITTLNMRADKSGGRPLHACARFDSRVTAHRSLHHPHGHGSGSTQAAASSAILTRMLLSTAGIEVDPTNTYGRTPLHVAASRGNWDVARLLLQHGANPAAVDQRGFSPGGLALKRGMVVPADLVATLGDGTGGLGQEKRDLIMDPNSNTTIICHELCARHRSCGPIKRGGVDGGSDPPPENVRRLQVLVDDQTGILRSDEFRTCAWVEDCRRAAMADVLKVHEYAYVEKISHQCSSLPDHPSAIASIDADTSVSYWSFEAALRAAGSVCEAVDKIMAGDHRNAFCAVRPPGHHAGPRGIVTCPNDPEGSHGFCLLNNVAIGASYARSMYRNDGIKKVAIIDFDVHHGNGTEEIVRQLLPNIEMAAVRTPIAIGSFQTSKYRPWLDEQDVKDVFFASTHGYGPRDIRYADHQAGWFYPASGETHVTDAVRNPASVEEQSLSDFLLTQTWARMGEASRSNCCKIIDIGLELVKPGDVAGMQRVDLRDSYRKTILPYLMDFDPDMIFISAGFDAHKRDTMNFGYVGMIEEDYEWVTEQLVKVANSCCNGRIVSVLEGGYKIHGGIVSPFARSVASHLRALVDAGGSREMYSAEDLVWESRFERQVVEEKERKRQMRLERTVEAERRRLRAVADAQLQSSTVRQTDPGGASHTEANDVEAMMNEPLHDAHAGAADLPPSAVGDASGPTSDVNEESSHQHSGSGDTPLRKRRRNQVDYRQLYEQMKKEEIG